MIIVCEHCQKEVERCAGHANRARKIGAKLFCSRACFGLATRLPVQKTKEQKIIEKRLYDIEYRRKNLDLIKRKKRAHFERTYDPAKAAIKRKENMPRHVEYCRQPTYKAWKTEYDRKYRADKLFGPFAESFLLLTEIEKEVSSRLTNYEIRQINGLLNKRQTRKRDYERLIRG